MPAAVESYYSYMLAVSKDSGIFFRDDRRDAQEFHADKDTITGWSKFIENHRWSVLNRDERKIWSEKSGRFISIPYRVLTHDEYVELYGPDECSYYFGNGEWDLPEKNTCPGFSFHQSEFCPVTCPGFMVVPVRKYRTKNVYKKVSESVGETDAHLSQELEQIISNEYQLTAQELAEIDFDTIMEMNIEAEATRFRGSIA
jgi:hypothetical protein